jgi:hypothetical protein
MNAEKERLDKMLAENKISFNDYKILLAAINNKDSWIKATIAFLLNPFKKIAGFKALVIGLIIIIGMSYLGTIVKVYYSAILDLMNAHEVFNPKYPLTFTILLYQTFLSWMIVSLFYIIAAKIAHAQKTRIIDFLGTVALARYPYLLFTVFLYIVQLFVPDILKYELPQGYTHPSNLLMTVGMIFSLCTIWQVSAYYYAFKESSGLTNKKLWISFIVIMIVGEFISQKLALLVM